jgi:hypothetical protein
MEKVRAEALNSNFSFTQGIEIFRIERIPDTLKIYVSGGQGELGCLVTFNAPFGFRVLDERDLLEYWPVCSTGAGWMFHILSGGWMDQDRKRSGSLMLETYPDIREYFIPSMGDCVSVLSDEAPTLTGCSPANPNFE